MYHKSSLGSSNFFKAIKGSWAPKFWEPMYWKKLFIKQEGTGSRILSKRSRRGGFQRRKADKDLWSRKIADEKWKVTSGWRWIILPISFLSVAHRCLPSFPVIEVSCYELTGGLWAHFSPIIWLEWESLWWNGIFRTVTFLVCNRLLPSASLPATHSHIRSRKKFYLTLS